MERISYKTFLLDFCKSIARVDFEKSGIFLRGYNALGDKKFFYK